MHRLLYLSRTAKQKQKKSLEEIIKLIPSDLWLDLIVATKIILVSGIFSKPVPLATEIKLIKGIIVKNQRDRRILLTPDGILDVLAVGAHHAVGAGQHCTIGKFESRKMQSLFKSQYEHCGCTLPLLEERKSYEASIYTLSDCHSAVIEAVAKLFTSYQS